MMRFIEIGQGASRRSIAVDIQNGSGPPVVWLCGFLSAMESLKGRAMAQWAAENGRGLIRFDYSGHGRSSGDYAGCNVSMWLEEALSVIESFSESRPILAGSSMGGWIAVLATLALRNNNPSRAPHGLVLIAPAIDFTEQLIWNRMPPQAREILMGTGEVAVPSAYSDQPYRFTRQLIEDGRKHLLFDRQIELGCSVHILQGVGDPDVPWRHTMAFAEHLGHDKVTLTMIRDGDHRLSRHEDIAVLTRAVAGMQRG